MTRIRIALAQVNPTVGDIAGNSGLALDSARRAAELGCDLLVLPEMVIPGYPIEDLALRPSFAQACMAATEELAVRLQDDGLGELTVIVGTLSHSGRADTPLGTPRYEPRNAAWVLSGGAVTAHYHKHHLPNYGVFDEYRYFVPGDQPCQVEVAGTKVSLAICEDLWQDGGPVSWAREAGSDLLVVLNGSPFEEEKADVRLELCQRQAVAAGCPLAYVNLVGGQDDLVFSGDSMVVDRTGSLRVRGRQLDPDLVLAEIDTRAGTVDPESEGPRPVAERLDSTPAPAYSAPGPIRTRLDPLELIYRALTVGLRDYVRKNGFSSVILGLSGGIDSALVAAIACDALGAENVFGVSMPSEYSSQHSRDDAADTAARTGLDYRVVPIHPMVTTFTDALHLTGLAEENLQARVRGITLMGLSNAEGHLVLATGNKTELAVGYSTIYGDAVGAFAPIKDVSKTHVWELSRWRNAAAEQFGGPPPIPVSSIEKPPSAELRPGQLDSDSLPDYHLLDRVLDAYVEQDHDAAQLVELGFDTEVVQDVIRLTDAAEYKRRQYPPGTKITLKAFGRDRRLPLTNRWKESLG